MSSDNNDGSRHMNDSTMPPPQKSAAATKKVNPRTSSRRQHNDRIKKGFGLSDWNRLLKSANDLAQRGGSPLRRDIRREEVAQHNQEYDGWVILHNKVYNIAPYLAYHPGGMSILKPCLGKDASELFDKYHRWVNVDGLIGPLMLGYLDLTPRSTGNDEKRNYLSGVAAATAPSTDGGFAVPAPRKAKQLPSLLSSKQPSSESDNEDDGLLLL
mmetsp:Transcript_21893/g.36170  ORF Transcript_21893/g.36170 Transcript_21893/m.36170 type:complete len:213 (-) Transcript_21893:82-720(-)|eukprot:CAMPEP_0119009558 /NCGR_PEP_ID=MMETSP1176-20130426/4453_1 /TAXON_ID=265551 /ORGANISM="Synedropsis recta cf, Strain CCMP1620" /LENGTH=212 /DNA_ID=CAMNT_0006962095 /DNA_START=83 /DNA_END=721 /DNA_ORIENTATION=-